MDDYDNRYHVLTGMPEDLVLPTGNFMLNQTRHSTYDKPNNDPRTEERGVDLQVPNSVDVTADMIQEVYTKETPSGASEYVVGMLIRFHYQDDLDLTMTIDIRNNNIVTVWTNEKGKGEPADYNVFDVPGDD